MMRRALAGLFAAGAQLRMNRYNGGAARVTTPQGAAVVSIGNIAMGGRGKSPLSQYVANWYVTQGYTPALLLRGYKGKMERTGGLVSHSEGHLVSAAQSGDEAFAAAFQCPGVQVRVGRDRCVQAQAAIAAGADVIVLDDGFQHRQIARALDIVLISPSDTSDEAAFFPQGTLRESPAGLTRANLLAGYASDWHLSPNAPPILFDHHPDGLWTPSFKPRPVSSLPHRVHLLCGIAAPHRFIDTVKTLGVTITSQSRFGDHHAYSNDELHQITAAARTHGAQAILTTVKDLTRIHTRIRRMSTSLPFLGLNTQLVFAAGEELLTASLRLAAKKNGNLSSHSSQP